MKSTALAVRRASLRPSRSVDLTDDAKDHARRGLGSENTKRAYRTDWNAFTLWCEDQGEQALVRPRRSGEDARAEAARVAAALVANYVTHLEKRGRKLATIERALAGISKAYELAKLPPPRKSVEVQTVMKGIRRKLTRKQERKAPVKIQDLRRMMASLPSSRRGLRDRAIILLGFAGAFRRSELCAVTVEDVEVTTDGLKVSVLRSKTDQEGEGRVVGIPFGSDAATCPVRAYQAWLRESGIRDGAVFRSISRYGRVGDAALSSDVVADVVKAACESVGLNPQRFAGHSLRAGLATAAARAGKGDRSIMKQTGHRSRAMVDRYVRDAALFEDNAASGIGL